MKLKELKKELIGKKLQMVIGINTTSDNADIIKKVTNHNYDVDNLQLLTIENEKRSLVFVDYDCDGYRSGAWFLLTFADILDKGNTTDLKKINSIIRDIQYFEDDSDKNYILITTDEYVITMGQENVSDYYPRNFFNVEETKEYALKEIKNVKGELVELELED